jgi:hypothetical protein
MLAGSACRMAATTPMRAEQREKVETAFDRLATLTPEQIAEFLDHRMFAKLALADEQEPRVSAINREHAIQLHSIAASNESIRAKVRAMKEEKDAHEAALKDVLTADQFTRFLALKDEMREALNDLRADK